jgi:hypothetical protein
VGKAFNAIVERGICDAIANSVNATLFANSDYRAGLVKGVCRLRAFLHSPIDHVGLSPQQVQSTLEVERKLLNQELKPISVNDAETEPPVLCRRKRLRLEPDGNLPIGWRPPQTMPKSLRRVPRRLQEVPMVARNALANGD